MIRIIFIIFTINLLALKDIELLKRLSPLSESLYIDLNNKEIDYRDYILREIDGKKFIGVLCETFAKLDDRIIDKYSLIRGANVKNYYSFKVPLDKYLDFCQEKQIKYLQIDEPCGLYLDEADKTTRFIDANTQLRSSQFFESDGVVVGVIDVGFQLSHPMFEDNNGRTRIRKAWFQGLSSLNRPERYDYGTEVTPNLISIHPRDTDADSHGSHVLGIAAGQGITGHIVGGVAQEADIIVVSPNFDFDEFIRTSQSDIVDGVEYIFDESRRLGKPCVINLSLGTQIGPHDGNALFDKFCAELQNEVGFGRSLVTAAGNDGERNIAIKTDLDEGNIQTKFRIVESNQFNQYLDIWGEAGEEVCVEFGVSDRANTGFEFSERTVCTGIPGNSSFFVFSNQASYEVTISSSPEESLNGKTRLFISIENMQNREIYGAIRLSGSGEVALWNTLFGGSQGDNLSSFGEFGYLNGIDNYQIGEIGGNSEEFITVASYNTSTNFINVRNRILEFDEDLNFLSNFSSAGPNADEILKPEISAPGSVIISSYNAYDQTQSTSDNSTLITNQIFQGNETNYLGALFGTSMSSPMVAGTIALMLRANPFLTQEEIKQILVETAYQDQFTGTINSSGSINWGYGKLNSYDAVSKAQERAELIELAPDIFVGPNPVFDILYISFGQTPTNTSRLMLANSLGQILVDSELNENEEEFYFEIDMKEYSNGIYFLHLQTDNFEKTITILKF